MPPKVSYLMTDRASSFFLKVWRHSLCREGYGWTGVQHVPFYSVLVLRGEMSARGVRLWIGNTIPTDTY